MTVGIGTGAGSIATSDEELAEYEQERPARRLRPVLDLAISVWCAIISIGVLAQVFFPLPQGTQFYLVIFLAAVLPITLLCYRGWKVPAVVNPFKARSGDDPGITDWILAVLAFAVCIYPLFDFDGYLERRQAPTTLDVLAGALLLILLLEACRRTTGWVLPVFSLLFIAYAYYGGYLPYTWSLAHQGFNFDAIIAQFTMGTAGFYGTPLSVAASYIVLFTIYGAVLDYSGAGKFFIDLSFAAFKRSRTAPGRTVTLAGFLLGSVSGSGTATAVSLGTVSWPILRRAGYPAEPAGGMLAASGIGAILSPPTLGAAAFIIAEFLQVSYLTVLGYAVIPTILYYLGILLAIEIDARRHGTTSAETSTDSALRLLLRFGYHFLSLFVIIGFMAVDVPPFKAVVYAVIIQLALSFLDREHQLTAGRLFKALAQGTRSVLPVAATCATAGVIVAVTTQTGLGLNLAEIIVSAAHGLTDNHTVVLILTVVLSGFAVLILGLAVPVTASFIIAAVIIAPALVQLGVTQPEAYMFIFYYAVLSEVSPPTALAAVATAAITGGKVMPTMWQAWKYTLPAFLVPFAFVLTDNGAHLLGQGSFIGMVWTLLVSMLAVTALAVVTGGWIVVRTGWLERAVCVPASLLLLYLAPVTITAGICLLLVAVVINLLRRQRETTAGDAVKGENSFKVPQDVAALTRLYNNYTQVAVRTSAGINSIADLKGKRVSTGSPNSGTEVIARRLLESAGLDPMRDTTAQRLGLPESVDAVKSGSIDALVWSGGLPTGGITDLTTSMGKNVKLLPIVDPLPKMQEKYGTIYTQAPIPAATYKQPADVATIVVPNVLLVRKNMKDDLAEQLTKVIYDNMDALVAVNAAAKGIALDNAGKRTRFRCTPARRRRWTA